MTTQVFRNYCVTGGSSTVNYIGKAGSGTYYVVDLVTTYTGGGTEFPPYYRYVRDLTVYMNIKYGQRLLERAFLFGKVLVADGVNVSAPNVIQPSGWKLIISGYIDSLASNAYISTPGNSKAGLIVNIDSSDPNEMDYQYPVQISGVVRQVSATVIGGFYFGN